MIYDIHAHIAPEPWRTDESGAQPPARRSFVLRMLLRRLARPASAANRPHRDAALRRLVWHWASDSSLDRIVFLALDGAYRRDGTADLGRTPLIADNDFVAGFVAGHPKLLFGASVHPHRRDALDELDRVAGLGACLIKWIPSAMNIAPDDPACGPFYERLARHGLPLLSHTGVEHALPVFRNALNDPERLVPALRKGVTVIAAHCGARLYLYERSRFDQWARLARAHPNLYGDLSAFGLPLHGAILRRILDDPVLGAKVLYGSDFPVPAMPLWYGPRLGWRRAAALRALSNPLEQAYRMMREFRIPEEAFSRAGRLLRVSAAAGGPS